MSSLVCFAAPVFYVFLCIYILCSTSLNGDAAACKVIFFLSLRERHHQVLGRYCMVGELHESEEGYTVSVLILCCITIMMLFLAQWCEG